MKLSIKRLPDGKIQATNAATGEALRGLVCAEYRQRHTGLPTITLELLADRHDFEFSNLQPDNSVNEPSCADEPGGMI